MSEDEPRRRTRPALAHQPDWSRRHAEILEVEPIVSLSPEDRSSFLTAIATVSDEADLRPEHQRLLRAARPELERRNRERIRTGRRAENGRS